MCNSVGTFGEDLVDMSRVQNALSLAQALAARFVEDGLSPPD